MMTSEQQPPSNSDYHLNQDNDNDEYAVVEQYLASAHHQVKVSQILDTRGSRDQDSTTISSNASFTTTNSTHRAAAIVVIAKSYYVTHSLRYPSLLHAGVPDALHDKISPQTWTDLQAQLGPLLRRRLFLPKSYLLVPILCMIAALLWFVCFGIATASSGSSNIDNLSDVPHLWIWILLQVGLMGYLWIIFARWVKRRNTPVDEELHQLCEEDLSQTMFMESSEDYRVEYCKTDDSLFATRILRFVKNAKQPQEEEEEEQRDGNHNHIVTQEPIFPKTDIYLETTVSVLFVMIILQCVNSLP